MGKIENAIEKLNNDIQKHPQDQYRALVGEHLIDCITTEEIADKVLEEGKTLEAALKTITANAKKKAVSNCAVIADAEGADHPAGCNRTGKNPDGSGSRSK